MNEHTISIIIIIIIIINTLEILMDELEDVNMNGNLNRGTKKIVRIASVIVSFQVLSHGWYAILCLTSGSNIEGNNKTVTISMEQRDLQIKLEI
jgi:hypothetical protein